MIIRKVAVGNSEEAFIEDTFSEGLNILLSDDNNKGKPKLCKKCITIIEFLNESLKFPIFMGDFNFFIG